MRHTPGISADFVNLKVSWPVENGVQPGRTIGTLYVLMRRSKRSMVVRQFNLIYGFGISAMALFLAAVAILSIYNGKTRTALDPNFPSQIAKAASDAPLAAGFALAQSSHLNRARQPG